MARTFDEYRKRREDRLEAGNNLEKMRLGQQACEIVQMISDPEIRLALVPLTEGEYRRALEMADKLPLGDNPASDLLRNRVQQEMILFFSAREMENLNVRFFDDEADVLELDEPDFNVIWDTYLEMVATASPTQIGLGEEDFEALKKVLPRIAWSELSGAQWYAAQRFLNSIRPLLLTVSLPGYSQTKTSTEMKQEQENAMSAGNEEAIDTAPHVEN